MWPKLLLAGVASDQLTCMKNTVIIHELIVLLFLQIWSKSIFHSHLQTMRSFSMWGAHQPLPLSMKVLIPCGLNEAKLNPRLILSSRALGFSFFRSIISIPPGLSGEKLWSPGHFKPFSKQRKKLNIEASRCLWAKMGCINKWQTLVKGGGITATNSKKAERRG